MPHHGISPQVRRFRFPRTRFKVLPLVLRVAEAAQAAFSVKPGVARLADSRAYLWGRYEGCTTSAAGIASRFAQS